MCLFMSSSQAGRKCSNLVRTTGICSSSCCKRSSVTLFSQDKPSRSRYSKIAACCWWCIEPSMRYLPTGPANNRYSADLSAPGMPQAFSKWAPANPEGMQIVSSKPVESVMKPQRCSSIACCALLQAHGKSGAAADTLLGPASRLQTPCLNALYTAVSLQFENMEPTCTHASRSSCKCCRQRLIYCNNR